MEIELKIAQKWSKCLSEKQSWNGEKSAESHSENELKVISPSRCQCAQI
jgi:hypothetical protein